AGAVWSGRLVAEKAPHLAIDAARMAGVPLRLLGPIHDAAYFRLCVEPRLGGDVEYGGHVSVPELAVAIGEASVAVVTPAWDEPFGLVVAEALACGTPVAGFARGALPELLDASTGALAPADDVEGLAAAIATAATLSRHDCRRRAERLFAVDRMVDDYEAMFAELLVGAP
ncbi:MAG: glycosyltransferase, partial [Acidimicrobiia bacterium]|nr:glycosyltransferase [Acidimicrobiia bacterium]